MIEKVALFLVLPLIAMVLLLCAVALLARGGRPVKLDIKGFGVTLALKSDVPTERKALEQVRS